MLEKAKKFIQERIGKNEDIWISDTSLNHLASIADKIIFSECKIRFRFGDEEMIFEMKSLLLGDGGYRASAKLISGFGYQAPTNSVDGRIF